MAGTVWVADSGGIVWRLGSPRPGFVRRALATGVSHVAEATSHVVLNRTTLVFYIALVLWLPGPADHLFRRVATGGMMAAIIAGVAWLAFDARASRIWRWWAIGASDDE